MQIKMLQQNCNTQYIDIHDQLYCIVTENIAVRILILVIPNFNATHAIPSNTILDDYITLLLHDSQWLALSTTFVDMYSTHVIANCCIKFLSYIAC